MRPKGVVDESVEQFRGQNSRAFDPLNLSPNLVEVWRAKRQVKIVRFVLDVVEIMLESGFVKKLNSRARVSPGFLANAS